MPIIMFAGRGGVGKTNIASATGVSLYSLEILINHLSKGARRSLAFHQKPRYQTGWYVPETAFGLSSQSDGYVKVHFAV